MTLRRAASFVAIGALTACGAFGGSDSTSTPPPATPDQNAVPPVQGAPITGVFVAAQGGTPDGDGSMARPLDTIAAGIALGKTSNQRVVVCAQQYAEALELVDGVSLYGYFDCSNPTNWVEVPDRHATVKSRTSPALHAANLTQPTRVEGFEIDAPDLGDAPPDPLKDRASIAASVRDSKGLAISKVILRAGTGAPGTDGVEPTTNNEKGSPDGFVGQPEERIDCNPSLSTCASIAGSPFGTSSCNVGAGGGPGGKGGNGMWLLDGARYSSFHVSTDGQPTTATAGTAKGGLGNNYGQADSSPPHQGSKGDDGAPGADGTDGANGVYKFAPDGYHAGTGTLGGNGSPGQGGGGGGGDDEWYVNGLPASSGAGWAATSAGGGGGAGGCGGLASAVPATGGGASVAAFVVNSEVSFEGATLIAGKGGRGGRGTMGTAGTNGGAGGPGVIAAKGNGSAGGHGGKGGWGGFGGHGAPGPAYALVWSGTRPATDGATQLQKGTGGDAPPALQKTTPTGTKTLPAPASVAETELSF
jgi:hypothetical protein